jgi:hypothetical protein
MGFEESWYAEPDGDWDENWEGTPVDDSEEYIEADIANEVGHVMTLVTSYGDKYTGKIMGVKDCGVFLKEGDTKHFCRIGVLVSYSIFVNKSPDPEESAG